MTVRFHFFTSCLTIEFRYRSDSKVYLEIYTQNRGCLIRMNRKHSLSLSLSNPATFRIPVLNPSGLSYIIIWSLSAGFVSIHSLSAYTIYFSAYISRKLVLVNSNDCMKKINGEISVKMAESNGGDGYMGLLQNLGREEILEVLSADGFCQHCQALLQTRIHNLINNRKLRELSVNGSIECSLGFCSAESKDLEPSTKKPSWSSLQTPESFHSGRQKRDTANSSPRSVNSKRPPSNGSGSEISGTDGVSSLDDIGLLGEQKEHIRFAEVGRKKDFYHVERINGKLTNVVQGLELHTRVFNAEEQKKIVECVYNLQRMGQKGQLRARTYSEPRKWMRGKGRITIQFGCCYNYAVDKNGNPPGIIRDEEVDPLPLLFKQMIKRMVRWHILPPTCVPNSCIVNIYDEGDCIPPHIDHHDFLRPFCTVSFLTECNILFGSNLKILNPGEFAGPVSVPLPVGSVLILSGNGADIAKHCVPGVRGKRISITFRKMDESKLPYNYLPEPELQGIKPYSPLSKSPVQQNQHENSKSPVQQNQHENFKLAIQQNHENKKITDTKPVGAEETSNDSFLMQKDDFPPLGSLNSANRQKGNRNHLKQQGL